MSDQSTIHTSGSAGWRSIVTAACATTVAVLVVLQLGGCACSASCSSCERSPYSTSEAEFEEGSERAFVLEPTMLGTADPTAARASIFGEVSYTAASSREYADASRSGGNLTQVSFAAEGIDFDPALSPDGDWMVFASTQHHEQPDLYRKSVDGKVVMQLTSDVSHDVMPEVSPDGRRIAFASNRNGNWDVFVMDSTGGPATQVTFDDADEIHPTWSPDGSRLCYCRLNPGDDRWELWILDVTRPGVRSFVCEGLFPRWSPDEDRDRLLFQRSRKRGERLFGIWTIDLIDDRGTHPTEVVAAAGAATMHPTWSPTGDRIAYTTVAQPSFTVDGMPVWSDICTIGLDGTGKTTLTAGGFRNLRPTWSSDDRIFFMSNRSGQNVIWAVSSEDRSAIDLDRIATTPAGPTDGYATVAPRGEVE